MTLTVILTLRVIQIQDYSIQLLLTLAQQMVYVHLEHKQLVMK